MSLDSEVTKNVYVGNGAADEYDYTFKIFEAEDLVVSIIDDDGEKIELDLNDDYSVDGVGDPGGGSITLIDDGQDYLDGDGDLLSGYTIVIRRAQPQVQESDFRNQGTVFPEAIEDQFDKTVMMIQGSAEKLSRAATISEALDADDFNPEFPMEIAGAENQVPVTNPDGDGWAPVADWPTVIEIRNAEQYAENAEASADLAEAWATLTTDFVDGVDNSAKAHAIGGTGDGQPAGGDAKSWATKTSAPVITSQYSAKEHAQGTQTRGAAGGGSAKDWATYTGGTVDDTEYSAKKYAEDAEASAAEAAAAAAHSQWDDVKYRTFADSPITLTDDDAGSFFMLDCSGGNIVINLPAIAGLTLDQPWSVGLKRADTDETKKFTVNRNGTDTIEGATSIEVTAPGNGAVLIPDTDASPDQWSKILFGDLSVLRSPTIYTPTTDVVTWDGQAGAPSNPPAGYYKTYVKDSDGQMYIRNSAGLEQSIGGGGGGAGLDWYFGESNTPTEAVLSNGMRVVDFAPATDEQEMFLELVVPANYPGGVQIKLLSGKFFSPTNTGNVLFRATSYLFKAAIDGTSVPTGYSSTNTQVAVAGTANQLAAIGDIDLTDSQGRINSVSLAAGDTILVKLKRLTSSETSGLADVARLVRASFQPKFAA